MNIHQVLQQKREQLAKLQAQIEVLEELASEVGASRGGRTARPSGKRSARRGRRRRAGRGANQKRVLSVLRDAPRWASEIARSAGLSQQSTTQVLMALKKLGRAEKTGRGLYRATTGATASEPVDSRAPRVKTRSRKASSRKPKEAVQQPSSTPEEVAREAPALA